MLVHGYRQLLRLAGLRTFPITRVAQETRVRGSAFLDAFTARTSRAIDVTESVIGRVVQTAPRPSRQAMEKAVERALRVAPRLAGRPVEVALMAATAVAAVALAAVLIGGVRSASGQVIDVVSDAVGSALTKLDLDQP